MRRGQKSQASTEIDRLAEYLMVNFQSERAIEGKEKVP
jgi:hypothetical protein